MKNLLTASIAYFSQEHLALDVALSTIIVVGCTLIGFLSRAMVMDLQANLVLFM